MSTLKLSSFQRVIFWGLSYNKPESFKYTVLHQGTTCAGRTCITYNYTYWCFKEKCMVLAFSQVGDLWIVWNSDCRTLHEHLFAKQEHSIEQEHVHLAPKSCPQLWVWSCEWAVLIKNTSTAESRNTQSTKIANSKTSFCVKSCASQAVQGPKDRTESFFPWVGVRNRTKQFLKVLKRSLTFLFLLCEFQVQSCSCSVHVTYTFCSCCVHFEKGWSSCRTQPDTQPKRTIMLAHNSFVHYFFGFKNGKTHICQKKTGALLVQIAPFVVQTALWP